MTIVGWKKDPLKNGRAIIIDANINVNCTPGNKIFLQLEKDLVQLPTKNQKSHTRATKKSDVQGNIIDH